MTFSVGIWAVVIGVFSFFVAFGFGIGWWVRNEYAKEWKRKYEELKNGKRISGQPEGAAGP